MKKYIIVEGQPILFGIDFIHAEVINENLKVDSAGFFFLLGTVQEGFKVICTGYSSSLGDIPSRPEVDSRLIAEYLGIA